MVGQRVAPADVVATARQPGRVTPVNVARALAMNPADVPDCLEKGVGAPVRSGEVIARKRELFGLLRSDCLAPCDGTIVAVSSLTGRVLIQAPPESVAVRAYLAGEVVSVVPGRGAVVATAATLVQGVYGVGGETWGELVVAVAEPEAGVSDRNLDPGMAGKILLGGAEVSRAALERAAGLGVAGIITGSVDGSELGEFLGTEVASTVTGDEEVSLTLVITEGFGRLPMDRRTFDLLQARQGALASISGVTHLRAGVVRPEVIVPWAEALPSDSRLAREPRGADIAAGTIATAESEPSGSVLSPGSAVRIVREPFFGQIGQVEEILVEPQQLPSGLRTRAARVALSAGQSVLVALANLEPA